MNDTRNPDRAYQYVLQARALFAQIEKRATVPADLTGEMVSLRRNLESAEADLTPPVPDIPPVPGA